MERADAVLTALAAEHPERREIHPALVIKAQRRPFNNAAKASSKV